MNPTPPRLPHQDVLKQRAEIRRGLSRVNTALLAIVTVVIGLALAGILAAYHAQERAEEARQATARARQDLWKSYLAQATADRLSATMGRKAAGEAIVASAARIRPSLELRSEAIAHMALTDLTEGHQEDILETDLGFTLSPDQASYAVANRKGLVEVRGLPDRRPAFAWTDTNQSVAGMNFSPDGRYLGVSCRGSGLQLLDVRAGVPTFCAGRLRAYDFSRDGQVLAALTDERTIHFFETASGRETRRALVMSETVNDVAFDSSGRRLAVSAGNVLQIWDCGAGTKTTSLEHDMPIVFMAWSEHYVAVGDGVGGVEVWDLRSKRSKRWMAHKALIDNLFFSHKGDLLVSDSFDGSCKLWNPGTGDLIVATTKGFGTAFNSDDSRLAYVTKSSQGAAWGWWRLARPRGFRALDCSDGSDETVWQVDFSPDGRLLAVTKPDGLRLVDFSSGRKKALIPMRHGRSAFFLPDGKTVLACGDDQLSLWPLEVGAGEDGVVHLGNPTHIRLPKTGDVDSSTMSLDRRFIALPLTDADAALIDLTKPGEPRVFEGGKLPKSPAISPDGKWVVTGTFHGPGAAVWESASGKKLLDLDNGNCNPVFSPDGKTVVLAGDTEYRFLESGSWKTLRRIPTGSVSDLPSCAAFSRDGNLLAIVKERHLLQLMDPKSGAVLTSLAAPGSEIINALSFNWDGSVLAAVTGDFVQLWDLPAIRRELAGIGLDWGPFAAGVDSGAPGGEPIGLPAFSAGSSRTIAFAVAAVGLVLFCAWFVLGRQRRLFASYVQIDELMEERNRELEVAHTEIMHSQKMKALGTLAAGIAHDFNNLLSVIRMSNKLIGRETEGNQEVQENVAEVEGAVQQGKHIVASMLGYSNENTPTNGSLFLPDLVEDTVGLLSRQFLSGITLDLELDRDSPAVSVPRARLEQILLNLIVNAAEAMDGRGHLRIQVRSLSAPETYQIRAPRDAPRYVELLVADSGSGITPEILSRIFDPFFTTKVRGANRGTGLGLSMVYTMAEQDGLGIGVETSAGKGATFRIAIPVGGAPEGSGELSTTN